MSSLIFDVLYRDHGAARGFTDLGKRVDQTSSKYAAFKRGAGIAALAAGAAILKFGKDSVAAYSEAESAQSRLSFTLAKFPRLADTNQASLQKLNAALQLKTKHDDDAIASGQAVLGQFKLTGRQLTEVTPLLLDYASKTGKDLPAAASAMGKAFLGNTKALKEIGINYKSTGDQALDFANITKLMRQQIGGFAENEGKTAAGQFAILRNQVGELQEAAGAELLPVLTQVTGSLTKGVQIIGRYGDVIIPLTAGIGGLAAVIWGADKAQKAWAVSSAVTSGLAGRAVGGLNTLKVAWTGVELSSVAAGRAMRVAQISIPVVGVALFAVSTALATYASRSDVGTASTEDFSSAMQSVEGDVTRATAALNENVRAQAVKSLQDQGAYQAAAKLGISYQDVTDAALGNKDAIARVNAVMGPALVLNRATSKANADQQAAAAGLSGTLGGVARTTKDAAEAERIRRVAMGQSTPATETLADAQRGLKNATKDLNTELQKSIDKMTILRDGALSQERANVNWEESLDNVQRSVKDNGKSLSDHTDKGRANRRAIVGAMEALDEKTKADYKNAASSKNAKKATEEANGRYRENREALRRAAVAAGYNKDEVDKLIRKYLKTPKEVSTDIKTPGLSTADRKVQTYKDRVANIKRNVDTDVDVRFGSSGKVSLTKGGRMTYVANASGGILPGFTPGRDVHEFLSTSPGVPNLKLSGGEPILRPEVGKVVGKDWVYGVNQAARDGGEAGVRRYLGAAHGGPTRAFARGGVVPSMGRATNAWKPARAAGRIVAANAADAVNAAAVALLKEAAAKAAAAAASSGSGASVKASPGWGPIYAAMRAKGARTFNTYPGHHPSAARARDVYPHNWAAANAARALSSVWYVIYRMRIASKTRGNTWQPYRPTNFRGDWRHVRHIHVARYDGGGMLPSGGVGVNTSGKPERVLTSGQNRSFERLTDAVTRNGGAASVVNYHVKVVAPNYVGPEAQLVKTVTDLLRSNRWPIDPRLVRK